MALFKHCGCFHEYKITREDRLVELMGGHPKCFLVWLLFVSRNCCQLVGVKIAEHYQQFLTCISICISSCTFCVCICFFYLQLHLYLYLYLYLTPQKDYRQWQQRVKWMGRGGGGGGCSSACMYTCTTEHWERCSVLEVCKMIPKDGANCSCLKKVISPKSSYTASVKNSFMLFRTC